MCARGPIDHRSGLVVHNTYVLYVSILYIYTYRYEEKPRFEITASALVAGSVKRVHVMTLTKHTYGIYYGVDGQKIVDALAKGNVTKLEVAVLGFLF